MASLLLGNIFYEREETQLQIKTKFVKIGEATSNSDVGLTWFWVWDTEGPGEGAAAHLASLNTQVSVAHLLGAPAPVSPWELWQQLRQLDSFTPHPWEAEGAEDWDQPGLASGCLFLRAKLAGTICFCSPPWLWAGNTTFSSLLFSF